MTDFYSEHYSADVGETGHFTTKLTVHKSVTVGKKHSRLRRTAALLSVPSGQDLADDDVMRFLDLKSGDRLVNLFFSMDANWGATADFNVGLHLKGAANDGAVVDENLFAATDDWSGAIAREDLFTQATTLDNWDRGKTLWELAAIGGGSDTVDPMTTYTITATCSSNNSATDGVVEFLVEAYYTSGD